MRNTSRTWHAYSNGDHTEGLGRSLTPAPARTVRHAAAFSRTRAGTSLGATAVALNPHSSHARFSTHVQSLLSGGTTGGSEGAWSADIVRTLSTTGER